MLRRNIRRRYRKRVADKMKGAKATAVKALRVAKSVRSLIEYKHSDTNSGVSVGTTPSIYDLGVIAAGTLPTERVGLKIKPRSFEFRGNIVQHGTPLAAGTTTNFRIVIWQPVMSRNATPTTILGVLEAATIDSPQYWNHRVYGRVLYDRVFALSASNGGSLHLKKWIRLSKQITYTTSSNIPDDGGIIVFMFSDDNVNKPAVDFYTRLIYTDA